MKISDVLDWPMDDNDANAATIRDYLKELLLVLWNEKESFGGKRPFGNSDWEYEIYLALVVGGFVTGQLDDDGYLEDFDDASAEKIISKAIRALQ